MAGDFVPERVWRLLKEAWALWQEGRVEEAGRVVRVLEELHARGSAGAGGGEVARAGGPSGAAGAAAPAEATGLCEDPAPAPAPAE